MVVLCDLYLEIKTKQRSTCNMFDVSGINVCKTWILTMHNKCNMANVGR